MLSVPAVQCMPPASPCSAIGLKLNLVFFAITAVVLCACVCSRVRRITPSHREARTESKSSIRLNLVADPEFAALLLVGRIGTHKTFFQIDTGYGGAPVLSARQFAYELAKRPVVTQATLEAVYRDCSRSLVNISGPMEAMRKYAHDVGCESFTAGCSIEAISIGTTETRHNELLHCPCVQVLSIDGCDTDEVYHCPVKNKSGLKSETVMMSSYDGPHILTSDWLLQIAPLVLWIGFGKIEFPRDRREAWLRKQFACQKYALSGGAPVIRCHVGTGRKLRILVDTGAAAGLTLDRKFASLVDKANRKLMLRGSSGETLCSDVGHVSFGLSSERLVVPTTLADVGDEEIDGFCGLHILRAFDIFLSSTIIGFKRNGLKVEHASPHEQEGSCQRIAARAARVSLVAHAHDMTREVGSPQVRDNSIRIEAKAKTDYR